MGLFDFLKPKKNNVQAISSSENVFSLPSLKNPHELPTSIDQFQEWHVKVLRRLARHPENEAFSGIITKEVDIPSFIPILQKLNLIDYAYYDDSLRFLKNESLKMILKDFDLPTSGNKDILVNRILNNISELDVRNSNGYSDHFTLTSLGEKVVDESYDKFKQLKEIFIEESINLIMQKKINEAYRKICKRNAEMPVPPGLNCDWARWYYRGIDASLERIYDFKLESSSNKLLTACAIYSAMSGDSLHSIYSTLTHIYGNSIESYEKLRTESSALSTERAFSSYESSGVEKYQFLSTLDEKTCPICGELDGKIFSVKNKEIGFNCPPIHDGCRCTTVAIIDEKQLSSGHRIARDPNTRKTYYVPRSTNWLEWKTSSETTSATVSE